MFVLCLTKSARKLYNLIENPIVQKLSSDGSRGIEGEEECQKRGLLKMRVSISLLARILRTYIVAGGGIVDSKDLDRLGFCNVSFHSNGTEQLCLMCDSDPEMNLFETLSTGFDIQRFSRRLFLQWVSPGD